MKTLADLWTPALAHPKADFMVGVNWRMSYGQLATAVRGWLSLFDDRDVCPGHRIIIRTANEAAASSAFIAALLDGIVPVILSPETRKDRLNAIVESVEPKLVLHDGGGGKPIVDADFIIEQRAAKRSLLGDRRHHDLIPNLPDGDRPPSLPDDPDELAYLLFTSGTTQSPSGVMISRKNLLANLTTLSRLFGYSARSRIFNDMVLAHADGMVQGPLLALANGCACVRSDGFSLENLENWLNRIRAQRASHVISVPTIWSMIDRYAEHDDYFDAPEMMWLISSAAVLDPTLWARIENRFSRPLCNQYGLTETVATAIYAGAHDEMGKRGTIGRPVDCEARIEAGPDGAGELQLRGDNIFMGYWQNPERTAASFTDDGWFRTGDVAVIDSDGSYRVLGRAKAVIKSGGFLIRPEEIDEVLFRHPSVSEVTTIALPDADFGEIPVSAVVLDSDVNEAELTEYARDALEPLKVPKRILRVDRIPRGESGKAQLGPLRQELAERMRQFGSEPATDDTFERVRRVAADVFRVDAEALGADSTPSNIEGWDSFSQVNLIFAIEDHFGRRLPVSTVAAVRRLGDFLAILSDTKT
ncbi:MAG: AMP-binding protein [Alphaproteobacteria bacterium]|nr:AMP-binding protein [Alphaproteobacteria bacterium]